MKELQKFSNENSDLLLNEFQEAWSHYRHLENTRQQMLGFLFTVTIAVIGFISTFGQKDEFEFLYTIFPIVWINTLLIVYIYTNYKKISLTLTFYEGVINKVRSILYKNSEVSSLFNIRMWKHPMMTSRLFSIQKTSENILIVSSILFDIFQGWIIFKLFCLKPYDSNLGIQIAYSFIFIIQIVLQIILFVKGNKKTFLTPQPDSISKKKDHE